MRAGRVGLVGPKGLKESRDRQVPKEKQVLEVNGVAGVNRVREEPGDQLSTLVLEASLTGSDFSWLRKPDST